MPNARPSTQTTSPPISSVRPLMPWKSTLRGRAAPGSLRRRRAARAAAAATGCAAAGGCAASGAAASSATNRHETTRRRERTGAQNVSNIALLESSRHRLARGGPDPAKKLGIVPYEERGQRPIGGAAAAPADVQTRKPSTRSSPRRARIAARERHAAGQENADPLLHGDVGIRRLLARADEHVAEIQMIGRHVDRDQRLRPLAAVDGELLGQEPEHEAARAVLDQHHPLEAVLVVGREGDDQLLDRRVDGAEHRHAAAGSSPPAAAAACRSRWSRARRPAAPPARS